MGWSTIVYSNMFTYTRALHSVKIGGFMPSMLAGAAMVMSIFIVPLKDFN